MKNETFSWFSNILWWCNNHFEFCEESFCFSFFVFFFVRTIHHVIVDTKPHRLGKNMQCYRPIMPLLFLNGCQPPRREKIPKILFSNVLKFWASKSTTNNFWARKFKNIWRNDLIPDSNTRWRFKKSINKIHQEQNVWKFNLIAWLFKIFEFSRRNYFLYYLNFGIKL